MEDQKEYRDFLEGFRALKIKSVDDDFIDAEGMEPVPPDPSKNINRTTISDEQWKEWYNDFENMYPSSYAERHKELRDIYPELYDENGKMHEREE